MRPTLAVMHFGDMPNQQRIDGFTLRGASVEFDIITYGGIITSIRTPDRGGHWEDIVLGYDSLDPYLHDRSYLGAVIGRYANRIACGRFTLDGVTCQLAQNDGVHHLHGGVRGFDKHVWDAVSGEDDDRAWVRLAHRSDAGAEGYPGALTVAVTYTLTGGDVITIDYDATTDAATIVNLTQHSYFNLGGGRAGTIDNHELTVGADYFTPVTAERIPTGAIEPVGATPFDFRVPAAIGARRQSSHPQLRLGGFDHNWVLNRPANASMPVATLRDPRSGRALHITTSEPGLQFYDGHLLGVTTSPSDPVRFGPRAGLCLETQHFPDSPNQPAFPTTVLRPGSAFRSTTSWRFACD